MSTRQSSCPRGPYSSFLGRKMGGRKINPIRDIRDVCACIGMCLMCSNTTMVTVKYFPEVENMELGIGFRG